MTLADPRFANAPAAHFDPEPFSVAAFQALEKCPLVPPGICANPTCSKVFAPAREWQRYCCRACHRADEMEMRRVGQKAAPALLAWRMGKHDKVRLAQGLVPVSPELRALSNAGRAYVTRLQSDWFKSRVARVMVAQLDRERGQDV